jgi:4-amino-4-deoxy-L-arabinose transferase-like glycosyltransferase
LFLALLCSTAFFERLGLNGMANYDDCFYAQQAKEIHRSGDWMPLTFNGQPSYSNGPLLPWSMALSYKVFGVGVYAAKFPSALAGALTVFLLFLLGRELFGVRIGLWAAVILATTPPFLKYARHAMMDVPLALFFTMAMLGLVLALKGRRAYFWLWGLGIALAILMKSALGLLPFLVTALFLAWSGRWRTFLNPHFAGGVGFFVLTTGAWVLSQNPATGGGFIEEHWKIIILKKVIGGESQPLLQHLSHFKDLSLHYWPWLPLAAWGLFRSWREKGKDPWTVRLLVAWIGFPLVALCLLRVRHPWYLVPLYPALALAAAYALERAWAQGVPRKVLRWVLGSGTAAAFLIMLLPIPLDKDREKDIRVLAPYVKHFKEQGARLVAFQEPFYGINNALLFFSDHATEQPTLKEPGEVGEVFRSEGLALCVLKRTNLTKLGGSLDEWHIVKDARDLTLISNRKVGTGDIRTWGGPWEN